MRAAVLERFGGPDELVVRDVKVPHIGDNDVLIKVEYAGIGQWDAFEREGGYNAMLDLNSKFPYILGSEGSGVIYQKGKNVENLRVGDKVYASGFLNPKGGFYAEFVSIDADSVFKIPDTLTTREAGVISGVGLTALRGLEDILCLKSGESIIIFGASGGVGHLAAQLAINIGAHVFAVASGYDGVAMLKSLGVEDVVNGRREYVVAAAEKTAPEGFDAALFTAGGEAADSLVQCIKTGGRAAYPNGIYPVPDFRTDISATGYNGDPDRDIMQRLNKRIISDHLTVHIDDEFLMEDVSKAHFRLNNHYLGKLCLNIS